MKRILVAICISAAISACSNQQVKTTQINTDEITTICNPLNLNYRFQLEKPSRREAADPTVILYHENYYLFASKSGGYWKSKDLVDWKFIESNEIPTEDYAPTVVNINDTIYFLAASNRIFKSINLDKGRWKIAAILPFGLLDPDLFLDDDGRLYLYWGCSDKEPVYGVELDQQFQPIGKRFQLIHSNAKEYGWEVPGDYNTQYESSPWIEGAWMNKHNGTYYLQYAGPGTQFKSYADGVYTSTSPLGPFKLAPNNPFASKPGGFACGAGHGSTFADKYGNYWHIGTVTISQKHMFERRLALYPAFFDSDQTLCANTLWGDYPMIIPNKKINSTQELFPNWMLLSYHKKINVSSYIPTHDELINFVG